MTVKKYHPLLRVIHWIMMIAISSILVLGFVMVEYKDCEPWALYEWHKSLGVLVFGLVWLRLLVRWVSMTPPLPKTISVMNRVVAHIVASLLYVCMILMPMSGYAVSNMNGFSVKFFSYPLPTIFAKNLDLALLAEQVHTYTAYALLTLLALHILGVILHHSQGEEILRRIT
ncbi:cytochrome b/b6 domain-containing protein [Candidatus Albibeggiatoa sp. nov. BB20]|uniref:cytochrome b n=1 Tax=Candidatus Albibeggiatoa sp. nov. BB20 TaxID=3162723 RepID=UPI0033656AC9